tara:strand:+ start:1577 stop:1837 length:261 start_codon:yes stop_codon:yes gene_type:complete
MAKVNWKKAVQAGALVTDALSKGSAGGLGKALVQSEIDLSGKDTTGNGDKTNRITGQKRKSNRPKAHDVNGDKTEWPLKGKKGWIA